MSDVDVDTPLWQIQIVGDAQNTFSYQVLVSLREALLRHPNEEVRSLQDVESKLRVRIVLGGPPGGGGLLDVDGVGVQPWRTALYVAGVDPVAGLDLIRFLLDYKVQRGRISRLPELRVQSVGNMRARYTLSSPWFEMQPPQVAPGAFEALPPRGRRHALCQLEWMSDISDSKAGEGSDSAGKYVFTVFGGIYPFRNFFEDMNVIGSQVGWWWT